jgi:tetratricopeptide (TPR) repeat protein
LKKFLIFILAISSCQSQTKNSSAQQQVNSLYDSVNRAYYLNDYVNCIILLNKLIRENPMQGEYFFKRGYCYTEILNSDWAITDFKEAIDLNYRVADSYANIGINYATISDSLALIYFQKSLQLDSSNKKTEKLIYECRQRLLKVPEKIIKKAKLNNHLSS